MKLALVLLCFAPLCAQEARRVAVCELVSTPAAYDRQLIEVTGFASHGFEDFTLFDPSCASRFKIWLEYGGAVSSGTMYCCGVTSERNRKELLVVDGITVPLAENENFRRFDRLVQGARDTILHATIAGRFFAGPGYGHLGCCSLLAIERVVAVDRQDDQSLDYRAYAEQPQIEKAGCGFRTLTGGGQEIRMIAEQRSGEPWRFHDSRRVAAKGLAQALGVEPESVVVMSATGRLQGRVVYEARQRGKATRYTVVVSRPYWLSFYASDPRKVAWVAVAAYEPFCK